MPQERFRETGEQSFFGRLVYDRIVPKDHFLMQLNGLIPWDRFARKLVRYYRGKAQYGPAPYNPVVILKMLLLSYLYNMSERQTEDFVNFNLVAKCFVGLAVDEPAPDYSTLSLFKSRLLENKKTTAFEMLLQEIIIIAKEKGVAFGAQILDSVHVIADVNVPKDEQRKDKGQTPHDPDAAWGAKHTKKVHDQHGNTVKQTEYFFGYKQHVSLNAATGLITSVTHTAGNSYDGHQLPILVKADLAQGIPVKSVTADRGYDDGENHEYLQANGMHSAIRLNDYRTTKKDANKGIWIALKQSPEYRSGLKERYKVEPKFGESKEQHGFRRCRYIGLLRFAVQGFLTVLTMNLKRLVVLMTGKHSACTTTAPIAA
jgi:IS5 family transposase